MVLSMVLIKLHINTPSVNNDINHEQYFQEVPDSFVKQLYLNQINEILDINSPVLIYRYSTDVCSSCLNEDLYELSKYSENLGKHNIIILPAYPNNRYARVKLSKELAKFNYRNISADSVVIPVDSNGISKRYFALISKYGEPEMVFFPEKGKTELTKSYIKKVQEKIKKEK